MGEISAKEKAQELVEKMAGSCCCCPYDSKSAAEECVNQILLYYPVSTTPSERDIEFRKYWEEVKKEIEKIK